MTTLNLQVNASAGDSRMNNVSNDAGRNPTGFGLCSITESVLSPGSHGNNDEWSVAARFSNVTIAQAATINSASFILTAQATYNAGGNTIRVWVSAQAADNASALTTASGNLNTTARPRSTASATLTITSVTANSEYSVDVTSLVQEIVNRAGWASGNAIVILVDTHADTTAGEWQDFYAYDGDTTKAPKLNITHGEGSGITGTAAITLAAATVVATSTLTINGTATPTLAAATLSATGVLAINGAASPTLADATLSATGALTSVGDTAITLAAATVAATGTLAITGALAMTLADATLQASNVVAGGTPIGLFLVLTQAAVATGNNGTANITLGDATLSAAGTLAIEGETALTLAAATLVATSSLPIAGASTVTLGNASLIATGALAIEGEAAITLANATLSATGGVPSGNVDYTIAVGSGYTDVSPKQLVRTATNRLYVCASNCDSYPCEAVAQTLRMYRANSTGVPSGFTRMDSAGEPSGVAQWAIAIDSEDIIHVAWTQRSSNGATPTLVRYATFDTATDEWSALATIEATTLSGGGQGDQAVALVIDASDIPHIVYLKSDGTRRRLYTSNRSGGTWASAILVDDQSFGVNEKIWTPNLTFDQNGDLLFAWVRGAFNGDATGTLFSRTRSGGSFGTTVQIATGTHIGIDQSSSLLVTADNRYHITWIDGIEGGDFNTECIHYAYSDDGGATWTENNPGGGIQSTHNPSLVWTGSAIRILGHGSNDSVTNHGENLYYFEGAGGGASWGTWTEFVNGTNFDSSINARWSRYHHHFPSTLDIAYWDDNYPNNLYAGTEVFAEERVGALAATLANASLSASGSVAITAVAAVTLGDATLVAAATLAIEGDLAATLADATLASAAVLALTGSLAATLQDATLNGVGTLPIVGALAATLDDATLAASGQQGTVLTGSAAITLADATVTATGVLVIQGLGAPTLADATVQATATLSIGGLAAITLSAATLNSFGTVAILGAATITLANATLVATGAEGEIVIPVVLAVVYGPAVRGEIYGPNAIGTLG